MKRYIVLGSSTNLGIRQAVNTAIADGWEPLGGVSVTSVTADRRLREERNELYFVQAMLKEMP